MTTTDDVTARVKRYLARFGTAKALEAECRRQGVRGTPMDCLRCVVAELVRRNVPGVERVEIYPSAAAGCVGTMSVNEGDDVLLPDAANRFAAGFDARRYPDLAVA